MDLTLRIQADFEKATKAFNDLANSSDATKEKIEKFADSFQDKHIDSFIDKQKLLQVSLTGTRGETVALQQSVNNYQKEIERLIKSGLSPSSEAVQRLANEQQKLKDKIKEANDIQKAQTELMKTAEKAAVALYAAIGAGIAATVALTQKTAEMGDKFAKTSRVVGLTAETFQELDYAAKSSGVNNLSGHLEKLNKTLIDTRNETGQLTKYLQENDKQLLSQVKNAKNNEEAFTLLVDAISKAPDELSKTELAMAAFGKSGQEIVLMAKDGAEGLSVLREEARKYGVISNEAAANSELYLDAQNRVKAALNGVSTELTSNLMPGMTQTLNKVADLIAGFDDWEKVLKIAGYTLAGLTAGVTAFFVIFKGGAALTGIINGFKALNAVIAANPIGAIAVVITTVLIPALIFLIKNWDTVQTYLQQGIARLEYAFKWLGSVIKEKLLVAFSAIKAGGATLIDFIYGNIIRAVGSMLEVMGKLPFVGEKFLSASRAVSNLGNAMGDMAAQARQAVGETIEAARKEQQETEKTLQTKLNAIDTEAKARRAEIEANKTQITEQSNFEIDNEKEKNNALLNLYRDYSDESIEIKTKLNDTLISLDTENHEKRIEANKTQITEQSEFEISTAEEKNNILLDLYREYSDEKIQINNELNNSLLDSYNEYNEKVIEASENTKKTLIDKIIEVLETEKEALALRFGALTSFFDGFSSLLNAAGKDNRAFAILSKAVAMAEAGINTALAATKALASAPPPWNIIQMAGVVAAGVAQQINIAKTAIPSAETGGRFIVPNSTGVDSALLRVNQGEVAEITPRGMTGQKESFNFNFLFDGHVFSEIINKQARAGELYTLQLASNI